MDLVRVSKIEKVIMILDNAFSYVVSSAKVGKSRGFSTLELRNMTLVFLPPNITSVVQHDFGSRYNGIFQNSLQEETFAVGFVTM